MYIYYPTSFPSYFRLHKVHYHAGDFHCGGFYNYNNNDKTTFVAAPQQAINMTNCGTASYLTVAQTINITTSPLTVMMWTLQPANYNLWHQVQYNFCFPADCDDAPLNDPTNSNCGNQ